MYCLQLSVYIMVSSLILEYGGKSISDNLSEEKLEHFNNIKGDKKAHRQQKVHISKDGKVEEFYEQPSVYDSKNGKIIKVAVQNRDIESKNNEMQKRNNQEIVSFGENYLKPEIENKKTSKYIQGGQKLQPYNQRSKMSELMFPKIQESRERRQNLGVTSPKFTINIKQSHKPGLKYLIKEENGNKHQTQPCQTSLDCVLHETCIDHHCQDPCVKYNPCNQADDCTVIIHEPVCKVFDLLTIKSGVRCQSDRDCAQDKACFGQYCIDPCLMSPCHNDGTACKVIYHIPICEKTAMLNTKSYTCTSNEECANDMTCFKGFCTNLCEEIYCEGICKVIDHKTFCDCVDLPTYQPLLNMIQKISGNYQK